LKLSSDDRLVTVGFRIPQSRAKEVEEMANLLHVKPSAIFRWIFDTGWIQKDRIVREKAAALLSVLGESLPDRDTKDKKW